MANDIYNYSVMECTGKGFITHEDSRAFSIQGFPADVWVATDVRESRHWVARNNGISKTKAEAQAISDAITATDQTAWDNDSKEADVAVPEGKGTRPVNEVLP